MASGRWTDALLDAMRLQGDEPADVAVRAIYATLPQGDAWDNVRAALAQLTRNDARPEGLPPEVVAYLDATDNVPPPQLPHIGAGEAVFALHGPEILMLLGCLSLPAAYAAAKGVQVLVRTDFLEEATRLRLFQTAQMVVDVMSPGGLGRNGKGIRTAQRVRLLHAAIRHLIRTDPRGWDERTLGAPINQEDLAGTLLTFSTLILDGLAKLGVELTPDEQQAYLDAWRAVGHLMGVRPELIPATVAEGRELMDLIHRRQIAQSPEGIRLTAALLDAMSQGLVTHSKHTIAALLARPIDHELRKFAAVMMRFLLDGEVDRNGVPVADILDVPPTSTLDEHLISLAVGIGAHVEAHLTSHAFKRSVLRWINMHLIQWMLAFQLDGRRPAFAVPATLQDSWKQEAIV